MNGPIIYERTIRLVCADPSTEVIQLVEQTAGFARRFGLVEGEEFGVKADELLLFKVVDGQPRHQLEYPPFWKMMKNAMAAAARTTAAVMQGQKAVVPDEVFEAREAVCRGCPKWDAQAKRCSRCGCYTSMKLKLARESCPDGHWTAWQSPITAD